MALSPNKRRFLALGLGFACLAVQIGTLAILLAIHKAGGSPGNGMGFLGLVVLAGVIPVGFSFLSAVWARNFDRAALITSLVPAAAAFIASYAGSVHEFGYREPHTMYHTIGGPAHPLDPIGQGLVILVSGQRQIQSRGEKIPRPLECLGCKPFAFSRCKVKAAPTASPPEPDGRVFWHWFARICCPTLR